MQYATMQLAAIPIDLIFLFNLYIFCFLSRFTVIFYFTPMFRIA